MSSILGWTLASLVLLASCEGDDGNLHHLVDADDLDIGVIAYDGSRGGLVVRVQLFQGDPKAPSTCLELGASFAIALVGKPIRTVRGERYRNVCTAPEAIFELAAADRADPPPLVVRDDSRQISIDLGDRLAQRTVECVQPADGVIRPDDTIALAWSSPQDLMTQPTISTEIVVDDIVDTHYPFVGSIAQGRITGRVPAGIPAVQVASLARVCASIELDADRPLADLGCLDARCGLFLTTQACAPVTLAAR